MTSETRSSGKVRRKKQALRADTTLAPAGKPRDEVYVRDLPACCLRSFKEAILAEPAAVEGERRRLLRLGCGSCGREWIVTSSLDERVLGRFVTHAGPRVSAEPGGTHPAA